VALLAAAALVAGLPSAAADTNPTLVTATVYAPNGTTSASATLAQVSGCQPPYSGPTQMAAHGPSSAYSVQFPPASTWALSTALQCGLSLPGVREVAVVGPKGELEDPLSAADLTPSSYSDAPGAVPVISEDGTEQVTYFRPWRGGNDDNADDKVVGSSPIELLVWESQSPLRVTLPAPSVSDTAASFAAQVTNPDGTAVPAADLTWSWNFGDGVGTSSEAQPSYRFTGSGNFHVTVQVNDPRTHEAGLASRDVRISSSSATGATPQNGAGSIPQGGAAPTGPQQSSGTTPGAPSGPRQPTATPGTSPHSPRASPAHARSPTPTRTASHQTSATTASSGSGESGISPSAASTVSRAGHTAAPTVGRHPAQASETLRGTLVAGRLISGLTPLPRGTILAGRPGPRPTAPGVRRAVRASILPGLAAGLVVLALLGLGAGRELRWVRWHSSRLGS
jgi:hypothetical protein